MHSRNPKKLIFTVISAAFAISAIALAILVAYTNQAVPDSDALFGGEIEYGYDAAGYLINEKTTGEAVICGATFLSSSTAITAAHCVIDFQAVYVGQGEFTRNHSSHIPVSAIRNYPAGIDLAILEFVPTSSLLPTAVVKPSAGCSYVVVAYGRTEDAYSTVKLRKSGTVCLSSVSDSEFKLRGDNSGICFGDSGSAILRRGSGELVGVVSAITTTDTKQPCMISNTAVAVRADVALSTQTTSTSEIPAAGQLGTIQQNLAPLYLAVAAVALLMASLWIVFRNRPGEAV